MISIKKRCAVQESEPLAYGEGGKACLCQSPRAQAGKGQATHCTSPGRSVGGCLPRSLGTAEPVGLLPASTVLPPPPIACYSASAWQHQPHPSSPPSAWWLWESSRRPGAPSAFTGTPPSGQRGEGGRGGTGKFWVAHRLGCLALEGHNWKRSDGGHSLSQTRLQFSGVRAPQSCAQQGYRKVQGLLPQLSNKRTPHPLFYLKREKHDNNQRGKNKTTHTEGARYFPTPF